MMFTLETPVHELISFLGNILYDEKWLKKQKNSISNFKNSNNYKLKNLNFIIITRIDSKDRLQNVKKSCEFLNYHFKNKIIICEYDNETKINFNGNYSKILIKPISEGFWRNYAANRVYEHLTKEIILNIESDVLFDPTSIYDCYNDILDNKNIICMPFDGIPIWLNKKTTYEFYNNNNFPEIWKHYYKIENYLQNDVYGDLLPVNAKHPGFCYMISLNTFAKIGMENQNFKKHGWEDIERLVRAYKMGIDVKFSEGVCYHLFHERNSKNNSYYFEDNTNRLECLKVCNMSKEDLLIYIDSLKRINKK